MSAFSAVASFANDDIIDIEEMPSTRKYVKKNRKRVRANDSDSDIEIEQIARKNHKNQFKISEILKNYQIRNTLNSSENILKYVPGSVKDLFVPYMKHVQMISTNLNLMSLLFKSNAKLLKPELQSKLQDLVNKTENKMNKLSSDLIEQLSSNYNQNAVYESLKASCKEPIVTLNKITDPKQNTTSNSTPIVVNEIDNYDEYMDSDIDLQIKDVVDDIEVKTMESKVIEPSVTVNISDENAKKNDPSSYTKNLQFDNDGCLSIYTDGCCLSNGRNNAQAGIGVWFNHNHPLNVAAPVKGTPTNNNAEIQAATKAILIASSIDCKKVRICTDSMFLINCMTTWLKNWKRNNWKTAEKQPVKNRESLEELDSVMQRMDSVQWKHIPGHKGCPGNEGADTLAKMGAQQYRR